MATAAALAYGIHRRQDETRYWCSIWGGTFDVLGAGDIRGRHRGPGQHRRQLSRRRIQPGTDQGHAVRHVTSPSEPHAVRVLRGRQSGAEALSAADGDDGRWLGRPHSARRTAVISAPVPGLLTRSRSVIRAARCTRYRRAQDRAGRRRHAHADRAPRSHPHVRPISFDGAESRRGRRARRGHPGGPEGAGRRAQGGGAHGRLPLHAGCRHRGAAPGAVRQDVFANHRRKRSFPRAARSASRPLRMASRRSCSGLSGGRASPARTSTSAPSKCRCRRAVRTKSASSADSRTTSTAAGG